MMETTWVVGLLGRWVVGGRKSLVGDDISVGRCHDRSFKLWGRRPITQRPNDPTAQSGFTLMEFIVTMALLAIIMPALTLSFRTALNASERVDRRTVTTAEARAVLPILTQDLQNTFALTQAPAAEEDTAGTATTITEGTTDASKGWLIGTDSSSGNSPADSLTFTTLSGRPPLSALMNEETPAASTEAISPFQQVNYSLEPGGRNGASVLVRAFASPPVDDPTATTDTEVLSDSVLAFNLEYFDGTDWLDNWDSTQQEASASSTTTGTTTGTTDEAVPPLLPQAIRVSLVLLSEDGSPQNFSTTVTLPMWEASASPIERDDTPQDAAATTGGTTTGGGGTTGGGTTTGG